MERFNELLKTNKVPMTEKLDNIIKRTVAGDKRLADNDLRNEIYSNIASKGDALDSYYYTNRVESPDIRLNKRYAVPKPQDHMKGPANVVRRDTVFEGIKTDDLGHANNTENIAGHGNLKKSKFNNPEKMYGTLTGNYVPRKGTKTIQSIENQHQSNKMANTLNFEKAEETNAN